MNKLLILIFALFLLLGNIVSAEFVRSTQNTFPYVIYGKVLIEGQSQPGAEIKLTNLRTGYTAINVQNDAGEFQFELGNFLVQSPWMKPYDCGDKFKIEACIVEQCIKEFILCIDTSSGGGHKVNFDLGKSVELTYVCPDGSTTNDKSTCPIIPVEKEVVEKEVIITEIIEDNKWAILSGVLTIVILGLGYLYLSDKKKYKWAKGFTGILSKQKKEIDKSLEKGDKKTAEKKRETLLKTLKTTTEKYLKK